MAKKSKRSRSGSPKSKKSRPGQMPGGQALATSEAAHDTRDSSVPEATSGEQTRAPESERRRRAARAGEMLPPPHHAADHAADHAAAEPSDPALDEVSIPPVTSSAFADSSASSGLTADVNELEDSFFVRRAGAEAGHAHAGQHDHHDDVDHQVDPRTAQKRTAAAQARRAHLTRYVKWTVGVSAALLVIGVGRVAFRGKQEFGPPPPIIHTAMAAVVDTTPHSIAAHDPNAPPSSPAEESQAAADQAVAALENPAPPASVVHGNAAPATDAVQTAPAADPAQKPADPAPIAAAPTQAAAPVVAADAPATPAAAPASDKTAAQEKKTSSLALERGNAKGAIEAGERSVALDPTDGEAWLVLGAAYQQVGKNADAKRCFNSCLKEGKRGPISECRAMLQ